jgi:hypothetical protein
MYFKKNEKNIGGNIMKKILIVLFVLLLAINIFGFFQSEQETDYTAITKEKSNTMKIRMDVWCKVMTEQYGDICAKFSHKGRTLKMIFENPYSIDGRSCGDWQPQIMKAWWVMGGRIIRVYYDFRNHGKPPHIAIFDRTFVLTGNTNFEDNPTQ